MTAYSHLTQAFFKSQLREPLGFFFVIVFSPMLLLILGEFSAMIRSRSLVGVGLLITCCPV